MDGRIGFDLEQVGDRDRSGPRHPRQIVAQQVDDHQIFGALLGIFGKPPRRDRVCLEPSARQDVSTQERDLLLGGPGAPVGISALGFILVRAAVVASRRYLVGVPFLFQWIGFCILCWGYVALVWAFTTLWMWTAIDPVPAMLQYIVMIVIYPLLAPLLARVRARDPLNVPDESRGTARPGETTS